MTEQQCQGRMRPAPRNQRREAVVLLWRDALRSPAQETGQIDAQDMGQKDAGFATRIFDPLSTETSGRGP